MVAEIGGKVDIEVYWEPKLKAKIEQKHSLTIEEVEEVLLDDSIPTTIV